MAQSVPAGGTLAAIEQTLIDAIADGEPSVVAIARVRRQPPGETFSLEFRPDPFGRGITIAGDPQPTDPSFIPNEFGTGVVVDRRGLILTAYHVLGEDSDYYVTTAGRKVYRAKIKAADPRSDLAVLAVEATDLQPITFGDADDLRKGQIVIALGNPYAIARDGQVSASWGIVANLARKAPTSPEGPETSAKHTLQHFGTLIQTDAKLNLGASGGPLLDRRGRMVGLCVALAAAAGYERAAGYAIPVDATFRRVVDTLKQGREVEYGFLGVQPASLDPQELLAGMQGIRVDRLVPGTPAARCGLRADDIVTAVNGRPIHEPDALVLQVGKLPVETTVRLSVLREGHRRTIDATLTKYPVRGRKIITTPAPTWRGMQVDYPTALVDPYPEARGTMAFSDEGVIVADVAEDTPAWKAGLRRGMLVGHVGRTAVNTPQQFRRTVAGQFGPVELHMIDDQTPVRTIGPGT